MDSYDYMDSYNSTAPYQDGNPMRVPLENVDSYTLADFGIDVQSVKDQMFGMQVVDPTTGKTLPDRYYQQAIKSAVAWVEKRFDIKILPRKVVEDKDYYTPNFNSYNYLKMRSRPILQVEQFSMDLNGRNVITYPSGWWKVSSLAGQLQIMPTIGMQAQDYLPYAMGNPGGNGPLVGIPNLANTTSYAPQLFHVGYIAGMLPPAREGVEEDWEMPEDLKFVILKQAAKDILQQWGRLIIGAGVASRSFSMDGISESVDSTSSATFGGASADILQLDRDIQQLSTGLDAKFGIRLGILG